MSGFQFHYIRKYVGTQTLRQGATVKEKTRIIIREGWQKVSLPFFIYLVHVTRAVLSDARQYPLYPIASTDFPDVEVWNYW